MGQGVQHRGGYRRPEKVHARKRSQEVLAQQMGSAENTLMVGAEQEDEQRPRAAAGELGSVHLGGDEPPDGEEIGPFMRVFRQFLNGGLGSPLYRVRVGYRG